MNAIEFYGYLMDCLQPHESVLMRSGNQTLLLNHENFKKEFTWLSDEIVRKFDNKQWHVPVIDTKIFRDTRDLERSITRYPFMALELNLRKNVDRQKAIYTVLNGSFPELPMPKFVYVVFRPFIVWELPKDKQDVASYLQLAEDCRKLLSSKFTMHDYVSDWVIAPCWFYHGMGEDIPSRGIVKVD